jgi:hypothetical protein
MLAGQRLAYGVSLAFAGLAWIAAGAARAADAPVVLQCAGTAAVTDASTGHVTREKRTDTYKIGDRDFRLWRDEATWSDNFCARKQTTCTPVPGEYHVVSVEAGKDVTRDDTIVIIQGYRLVEHKVETSDGSASRFQGKCAKAADPAGGGGAG